MRVDYHLHTKHSFDGVLPLREVASIALKNGMQEIAITDHMDFFEGGRAFPELNLEAFLPDFYEVQEEFRGRLILRLGAEIGQAAFDPEGTKRFLQSADFDFILGSIHNLKKDRDIYYIPFHKKKEDPSYQKGIFSEYLSLVEDMAANEDFDSLAHLTYPLRYMVRKAGYGVDLYGFREQIDAILDHLIRRGKALECNASDIYRVLQDTLPPFWVLKRYREKGGELVTIGSDGHRTEGINRGIQEGMAILKAAGFRAVSCYEKRKVYFLDLD